MKQKGGWFKVKQIYFANAFSLQMLDISKENMISIVPLTKGETKELLKEGFISAIGHPDTAQVLTSELGFEIELNRISLSLGKEDVLLVAQLTGGRLPEGSTTLPDGFAFKYLKVELL